MPQAAAGRVGNPASIDWAAYGKVLPQFDIASYQVRPRRAAVRRVCLTPALQKEVERYLHAIPAVPRDASADQLSSERVSVPPSPPPPRG